MSKTIVQLKGVQKTYDGANLVVKDLNLNIREGEFVTMFDPLGSGKTTTLMMLAGFETATHGKIFLKENPLLISAIICACRRWPLVTRRSF